MEIRVTRPFLVFLSLVTSMVALIIKSFIERLNVKFDILIISFFIFLRLFYVAQIVSTFGCHYPKILNSLSHCICEQKANISAAAGFEPVTPGL